MDRRVSILVAAVAALLTSACQDYNFNPVGHCVIQPGTRRQTLSTVSTADLLLVVDDSGSMAAEQSKLATEFSSFVGNMSSTNSQRVSNGLDPIDFHIAITTTSMSRNPEITGGSTCENDCIGAIGSKVCCLGASGLPQPPYCRADADCATGYVCRNDCPGAAAIGAKGCFRPDTHAEACAPQQIACTTLGEQCSNVQKFYSTFSGCTPGYADNLFSTTDEYPMGRFMAAPSNPVVLHFDKDLYCTWNAATGECTDAVANPTAIAALQTDFSENVTVGTCGSTQEQGLEAAKAAIERARGQLGGQTAGYTSGEFLHPSSKLVVVWVTDEDDCSSPSNPATALPFWEVSQTNNACLSDAALPADQQREFSTAAYASYFTSLGRPFSAAFVASYDCSAPSGACSPGICCDTVCTGTTACTSGTCGGQGVPLRYQELAAELANRGVRDVQVGSICDTFGGPGQALDKIARIVKPPRVLELPTLPAAGAVTLLRIVPSGGGEDKLCGGPAPETLTVAQALAAGYDWWFVAYGDPKDDTERQPVAISKYVFIVNQETYPGARHDCDANPGETYSADYLGRVPADWVDGAGVTHEGGCNTDTQCSDAMGGAPSDWTCFRGYDLSTPAKCLSTATTRGTCVCGSRASTCPNGTAP